MMARLERLERRESKPSLCVCVCVCESNCVCIQGVYMCGCVHNACVTGLCRWLLCVCMRVYIVQGWDMETQDRGVCLSGLLCVWTWACACFLHMSLHAALITGCPVILSLRPFSLCVSALFFTVAVRVFVSVCVCGLRVPLTYM